LLAQASYFMPTMPGPGDDFSDVAEVEAIRLVPDERMSRSPWNFVAAAPV
jgi:hypothetical protein